MESKLIAIPECVKYVNEVVEAQKVKFCFLSDAPFLVKVISKGGYCACGDTVYVPSEHFKLATSKNETDRAVATAKLLSWIMAMKDGHFTTVWKTWLFLNNWKLLAKYFIYEYGFLKVTNNNYCELVLIGFISTRKSFFGRSIKSETVVNYIRTFL